MNLIIEFDGDFWHCNPAVYPTGPINNMQKKAIKNDLYKTDIANARGYTLIRVWEKDFNENLPMVKERLLKEVKKQQLKEILDRAKINKK